MFGSAPASFWIGFHVLLALLLLAEYLLLRKQTTARSYFATALWVAGALGFGIAIYLGMSHQSATEYLAGYAIEESLSIDNLFVFLLLFESFHVPKLNQRRVLFWGILLAVLMRAGFIFAGVELLHRFEWITYVFGLILLIAAIRLLLPSAVSHARRQPSWIGVVRRLTPISNSHESFFVQEAPPSTSSGSGQLRTVPTMLFLALIAIGLTDLVFALDSIPAVLSITKRPFIAYSSNVMAVMGLRSLFFVLTHLLERLSYLHYGLAAVLAFAAVKMLAAPWLEMGPLASLAVIGVILAITVVSSLAWPRRMSPIGTIAG